MKNIKSAQSQQRHTHTLKLIGKVPGKEKPQNEHS